MTEPFIGQIELFGFDFAPEGWLPCEGQLLSITEYKPLFSLLGTYYGGNGKTTFALPDLRGRVPIGFGQGPGLSNYAIGQASGSEQETLLISQLPEHSHPLQANSIEGTSSDPASNNLAESTKLTKKNADPIPVNGYMEAAPNVSMADASIGNTGGSQAHSNMMPYLTLRYCIAVQGIFPPRN